MKMKNRSNRNDEQPSHQEFFELPRAEYLVQDNPTGQIGDLVTNPARQMMNRFAMQATDDHMKGADIQAGDYMVVEKKDSYQEGCILAVQLGNKQLVRRYLRSEGRIRLQCDPPSQQIIIVDQHTPDFQILGQVIQIIREIK
jgi:SOS-response transcriptional repressor LexA